MSPEEGLDPEQEALVGDSVGLAVLVVLDSLTPAERVAFVLHDVFAVPFHEIAQGGKIVGIDALADPDRLDQMDLTSELPSFATFSVPWREASRSVSSSFGSSMVSIFVIRPKPRRVGVSSSSTQFDADRGGGISPAGVNVG